MTVPYDAPHKQVSPACQATRPRPGARSEPAGAPDPPGAPCPYARCPNYPRLVRAAGMIRDLARIVDTLTQKKGA